MAENVDVPGNPSGTSQTDRCRQHYVTSAGKKVGLFINIAAPLLMVRICMEYRDPHTALANASQRLWERCHQQ